MTARHRNAQKDRGVVGGDASTEAPLAICPRVESAARRIRKSTKPSRFQPSDFEIFGCRWTTASTGGDEEGLSWPCRFAHLLSTPVRKREIESSTATKEAHNSVSKTDGFAIRGARGRAKKLGFESVAQQRRSSNTRRFHRTHDVQVFPPIFSVTHGGLVGQEAWLCWRPNFSAALRVYS